MPDQLLVAVVFLLAHVLAELAVLAEVSLVVHPLDGHAEFELLLLARNRFVLLSHLQGELALTVPQLSAELAALFLLESCTLALLLGTGIGLAMRRG